MHCAQLSFLGLVMTKALLDATEDAVEQLLGASRIVDILHLSHASVYAGGLGASSHICMKLQPSNMLQLSWSSARYWQPPSP